MEVSDGLKISFFVFGSIALIIAAIVGISGPVDGEWSDKSIRKWFTRASVIGKWFTRASVIGGICIILGIATPMSTTIEKMMIASFVTEENVEKAKGEAMELVDYITEKVIEVKREENK